jgi:hypothetical protein
MEFRRLPPGTPVPEGWKELMSTRRGVYISRQSDVVMKGTKPAKIVRDKTQRKSVKAAKPVKRPITGTTFGNPSLFAPTAATSLATIRADSEDEDDEMADLTSRMGSVSLGIQVSLDELHDALMEEGADKTEDELTAMLQGMGLNPEWGGEGGRRRRRKTRKNRKKRRTTRKH